MSPTVLEFDGIKVKIYVRDHNPPHVHVIGKGHEAIFEVPSLDLISNSGFSRADIVRILNQIGPRVIYLWEYWNENHRD